MKEDAEFSVRFVWYAFLGFVVFAAIGFGVYALEPTWLGLERQNFVNSHQYIEGKRTLLLKLASEYDENSTEIARYQAKDSEKYKEVIQGLNNQQESLYSRIKEESQLLPDKEVPDEVKKIIWTRR